AFAPCSTIYFAVESMDLDRGENLFLVRGSVARSGDPAARCPDPEPDAGPPDAAAPGDASASPDAGASLPPAPAGCGCRVPAASEPTAPAALAAVAMFALRARRRRRAPS
ncbi:MAG: MYXO-CTERM sorting domain-containing protein, partial [Deltaproteobacteria bacterium]